MSSNSARTLRFLCSLFDKNLLPNHVPKPWADGCISQNQRVILAGDGLHPSAHTDRLVRAYNAVEGVEAGFHLAGIPEDYEGDLPLASFEPETMTPLFRYGESLARTSKLWLSEPPGIN